MFLVNRRGLLGVVLAVVIGYQVAGLLAPRGPDFERLGIPAGALFLGLYGLTVDRCEVGGLIASYRANVQNIFAAVAGSGVGTYDKTVVPGRRMAIFFMPLAIAPLLMFPLALLDVALRLSDNGALSRWERFEFVEVPLASIGLWVLYALATRGLRLQTRPSVRESVHFHF